MKTVFDMLCRGHHLSQQEAQQLLQAICNNELNDSQIAAIMAFYITKPVTVEELRGFKNALLNQCIKVTLNKPAIDVCGTGGDQKNTFNISTLSAIVLAAAGVPVAKHGNYGSSSISGSSDILKYLGYTFLNSSDDLNRQLEKHNICFIHAPLFHPALKNVAKVRKEIGVRTFFNMLGPLVNPANISYKYIGVYNLEIARLYNYILQTETANYSIVHSIDGYDEISLTSDFKHIHKNGENLINPLQLGFNKQSSEAIFGGTTIAQAADIFMNVLNNSSTIEQKNAVLINSAMAMNGYNPKISIQDSIALCKETIESKKAYQLFKNLINSN